MGEMSRVAEGPRGGERKDDHVGPLKLNTHSVSGKKHVENRAHDLGGKMAVRDSWGEIGRENPELTSLTEIT